MYHVTGTGVAAILLYLISYILYRSGFYSRYFHRKIWNTLLATTFLLAATAGLFLALQINYKWNIPFIKTVLKWHVECGIGLTFTGLIHFIWHLTYYFKPENSVVINKTASHTIQRPVMQNGINLFLVGFVSSSLQLLLMREIMNISGGYELVTGTFLASWLIGSAAGSAAAKKSEMADLKKINVAFGLSPVISLFLMIIFTRIILHPGEIPSFFVSIIFTFIVLIPFTFISGFTFIKILSLMLESRQFTTGRSFSVETAGGIAAGLTISFFGIGILNTYQMILLILVLYLYYVAVAFLFRTGSSITALKILTLFICSFIIVFSPDIIFRKLLLPGVNVTVTEDTPYGNITTGEYGGEETIYYNHHLIKWQNDEMEREENIHYAMIQREKAEKILVISGDIGSNLNEILKYPVRKIVYVERDPALIKYLSFSKGKIADMIVPENADAFRYIKKTSDRFDMIMLCLPPPSTLQLNRYYTSDFFLEAKKRMNDNGVFVCSPGTGENYFNRESEVLYSSVFNSLSSVFRNVLPIVGNKLYYLASDGVLSTDISLMIQKRGINNSYVNDSYLADDLIKSKSDGLLGMLDRNVKKNTILVPVACFHYQSYNLSKAAGDLIPAIILIILLFLLPLFAVSKKNLAMYSGAGALAGFEIVLLLSLQSTAGNMYQLTGLIIAALMTGLAAGAGFNYRWLKFLKAGSCSLAMLIFYIITGLAINVFLKIETAVAAISIFVIISLVPSFFTGRLFRLLTENDQVFRSPSGVYGADLAGSALGFIAVSAFAVPLLGIPMTLFLLSAFIFIGIAIGTITNK